MTAVPTTAEPVVTVDGLPRRSMMIAVLAAVVGSVLLLSALVGVLLVGGSLTQPPTAVPFEGTTSVEVPGGVQLPTIALDDAVIP